jgi:hypothetical protein
MENKKEAIAEVAKKSVPWIKLAVKGAVVGVVVVGIYLVGYNAGAQEALAGTVVEV